MIRKGQTFVLGLNFPKLIRKFCFYFHVRVNFKPALVEPAYAYHLLLGNNRHFSGGKFSLGEFSDEGCPLLSTSLFTLKYDFLTQSLTNKK